MARRQAIEFLSRLRQAWDKLGTCQIVSLNDVKAMIRLGYVTKAVAEKRGQQWVLAFTVGESANPIYLGQAAELSPKLVTFTDQHKAMNVLMICAGANAERITIDIAPPTEEDAE